MYLTPLILKPLNTPVNTYILTQYCVSQWFIAMKKASNTIRE